VDTQGDLVLSTAGGPLRFQKPVIYQERDGHRQAIAGGYVHKGLHQVGFHVAAYDTARVLVIDPVLHYATYLGGSGGDDGASIAVDTNGAAYVTGVTFSPDFPTVHPLQPAYSGGNENAFVAKLSADGSALVYATYLGGSAGAQGTGIAIDATGAAYVTGSTTSSDFPITPGALQATFGGGDCSVSGGEFLVLVGTLPPPIPPTPCADAFVVKLSADGAALVYATYLGGRDFDEGKGIAVDAAGTAYVTGSTNSSNFPTAHPLQPTYGGFGGANVFVAKLAPNGSALVYTTYLAGSRGATGTGIAVDAAGAAYVTGETDSSDFPTMHPLQPTYGGGNGDAFVAKLTADGSALVYATYLGGSGFDRGSGIAVDAAGAAYVTGFTTSSDFPTVQPLQSTSNNGDAFVAKLAADGSTLVYATHLAGSSGTDAGAGITVDAAGTAYVTGFTTSSDFPTVHPLQPTYSDGVRGNTFVAKLGEPAPIPSLSALAPASATISGPAFTLTVTGTNFVPGAVLQSNGASRTTTFGSDTQLTAVIPVADLAQAGTVAITVVNPAPGGGSSDALAFTVTNPIPSLSALVPASATASGPAFTLTVTGANFVTGAVLQWNSASRATTFVSDTQLTATIPAADLAQAGTVVVTVVNPAPGGGSSNALAFTVTNPIPSLSALMPASATISGPAFTLTVTGANFVPGAVVQWNGASHTTTFVSDTQLTAAIPAADLAQAGTVAVTVMNPAPGGGSSNALAFAVNNLDSSGNPDSSSGNLGSSGGGCTLSPGTTVDPTLVSLLGCSIVFLGLHRLRRRSRKPCRNSSSRYMCPDSRAQLSMYVVKLPQ
jgi:hypothetical protein